MATFVILKDGSTGGEIVVNADLIVSIRPYQGGGSTISFAHTSFGVKETPQEIAKKSANTKW